MDSAISRIVIVGGGTAGWLSACLIAARINPRAERPISVTLIESPDVPAVGVGEGTWPTMRHTLERIGISESEFLLACDGSFKQGSRFTGWANGADDDRYLHPFTPPPGSDGNAVAAAWRSLGPDRSFAQFATAQARVCSLDLAPRQRSMPGYAGALNYAYHLDAGKLAALLASHATTRLGVTHVRAHVTGVEAAENGDIDAVRTRGAGTIAGDLFIDCTGHAASLIGEHFAVPFVDRSQHLFNDRALAVQVPVGAGSPIASQTDATAHEAGWIWDIGLPTRRGIGCVYSSAHMDDAAAVEVLRDYLAKRASHADPEQLNFRQLSFRSGHRTQFWKRNCLAVGLSAGFLEPLEASAIVLIELSLGALLDDFPPSRSAMEACAGRFNETFRYRWDRIVEFLKLHYVPSRRDEPYWRDHRDPASIPDRLSELLATWRHRAPSRADFFAADEVFPAASYQYVLYGMGWPAPGEGPIRSEATGLADEFEKIARRGGTLAASLPTNRAYSDALRSAGVDGPDMAALQS